MVIANDMTSFLNDKVLSVTCGEYTSACITNNGELYSWGKLDNSWVLGYSNSSSSSNNNNNNDNTSLVIKQPLPKKINLPKSYQKLKIKQVKQNNYIFIYIKCYLKFA